MTLSLQQYQHPLDGSELTKQEKQQIIFYKGLDLTQLARFELSETDYPLASFWRGWVKYHFFVKKKLQLKSIVSFDWPCRRYLYSHNWLLRLTHTRSTRCYWLIENERKQVGLYVYTMNNQSLIEHGQKTATLNVESPRDPEQWDKLRKVQPKTECKFEPKKKRTQKSIFFSFFCPGILFIMHRAVTKREKQVKWLS